MGRGDLGGDREAEAGPDRAAGGGPERLAHPGPFPARDAGPVILHRQQHPAALAPDPDGEPAAGAVPVGVVDQVRQSLAQRDRVARNGHGLLGALVADIDRPVAGLLLHRLDQGAAGEPRHVDRVEGDGAGAVDHHGVVEELVGEVAELGGTRADAGELVAPAPLVGLARQEVELGGKRGQRRADLVRRIRDEALHHRDMARQPAHEVVDRGDEQMDLPRGGEAQRLEFVGPAGRQHAFDGTQRPQGRAHRHRDGAEGQRAHRQHHQARLDGERPGEPAPRLAGLGHHHGGEARLRGVRHVAPGHHRPHRLAAMLGVEQHGSRREAGPVHRHREVGVTGEQAVGGIDHLVEDPVAGAEAEGLEGRERRIDRDLAPVAGDGLGDLERRSDEEPVVGLVGGEPRRGPGGGEEQPGADREHQGQHRDEAGKQRGAAQDHASGPTTW